MNDFQRRRLLTVLEPFHHIISVPGESAEVTYVSRYGQDVAFERLDRSFGRCALGDFEFDFGQLTEEEKLKLERSEIERCDKFTSQLPKRLRENTFEAIDVHSGNREAYERCKALEYGRNLFIHGDAGNGKTMLAVATAKHFAANYTVGFWSAATFCDAIRSAMSPRGTAERPNLKGYDVLVLDDIDKAKPSDFVYEALYSLINYRWENEKTTIFTSNRSVKVTAERASPDQDNSRALMSRMASGEVVEVAGPDRRVLQGKLVADLVA